MLPGQLCVKCLEDGIPAKKAEIRCRDCGHGQFYCFECAESLHRTRNVFHLVEVWKTDFEMFVPLLIGGILCDSQHANCSSTESRTIICVDGKGRQHLKIVEFCQCIKDAEKLIKLQLWPGSSSKPKIAFHFDFMDFAEKFLLESHVSLHKFCSTVEVEYPEMLPRLVKNIYNVLNNGSFDEYRYFKHQVRSLKFIQKDLIDYRNCPLCPQSCQIFKAGEFTEALHSKGKNQLFDEKGVFGSCCSRHSHPGRFFSTKYGERISYSLFLIQSILKDADQSPGVDLKIMYDIGCVLSSHLKANKRHDILSKVSISVPIFHCYGHKASCQVKFSPRRLDGFGLTDGEAIERLWAYLRGFSAITKEMSASRRVDLLTDALLHLSRRNFSNAGKSLTSKLKKCLQLKIKTQQEMKDLFSELPVTYDPEIVCQWEAREKEIMSRVYPEHKEITENWKVTYVQKLLHFKQLSATLFGCFDENQEITSEDYSIHQMSKKLYHHTKKTKRYYRSFTWTFHRKAFLNNIEKEVCRWSENCHSLVQANHQDHEQDEINN
ncbi:uncharacterized protein LOC124456634 [Xenia sp. Carnegie-2017]|uniref:uncharacterized protein LOC124456634 n=1 Tax=Xenia sp. Carnegie-2017 TaxID=2897299 RepID=UPI001F040632|nr:uncharacterized protein LOC124456634 [Xenia sp. Carnegie-2017]